MSINVQSAIGERYQLRLTTRLTFYPELLNDANTERTIATAVNATISRRDTGLETVDLNKGGKPDVVSVVRKCLIIFFNYVPKK